MSLSYGIRLGPYEVLANLGAGGMGEVYRARDTRLGREVAVKVLPEFFAADAERLRRFEQEARAVSTLNHPNILSVHDVGKEANIHFLVTELLEGQTLRELLREGPLRARKATEYASQIARGLAAAHEKGVIHRDIKPENIFVTRDGLVKILDFGLAKLTVAPGAEAASTLADTAHTTAGAVFGTIGYMSPEQVKGEPVDARTDLFAFGVVFYEMLKGKNAFQRDSSAETISAILKEEPDVADVNGPQIPVGLQRIILRCLEKNPAQRFQSAKDLGFALESHTAGTTETQRVPAVQSSSEHWWRKAAIFLGTLLLAVAGLLLSSWLRSRSQPNFHQLTFRRGLVTGARFAGDGQTVIYSAVWGTPEPKLFGSRLDGSDIRELELPSGALLAVSVSGELAIALANGNLARVPPGSRAPREVLEGIEAADFSPDGKQLAVTRFVNGKSRLEYPIGRVLFETIGQIGEMRISPKGDAIAFMEHPVSGDDRGTIALVDVEGHKRTLTREWNGEQGIAWSADGREIWFTATERYDWERALYAVTPSGQQRVVLRSPAALYLQDISRDGRILLNRSDRRFEVVVADLGGKTEVWNWAQILVLGSVSRDGQYAVVGDWGSETTYSTYLARFDGSPPILLGSGAASGISPDNKWVASILPSDTSKVLLLPTGVGDVKTITAPNFHYRSADWTADGNLVVRASEGDRPIRFWTQDITGGQPRAITPEGVDGRFVTVKNADYVCARDAKEKFQLFPITAGTPRAVPGLSSKDAVVGGSPSSNVLYVMPENWELTAEVWKVNIDSGTRSPFFKIGPSDTAGVIGVSPPKVVADGRRYLYVQVREFSVLYEAAGVK